MLTPRGFLGADFNQTLVLTPKFSSLIFCSLKILMCIVLACPTSTLGDVLYPSNMGRIGGMFSKGEVRFSLHGSLDEY